MKHDDKQVFLVMYVENNDLKKEEGNFFKIFYTTGQGDCEAQLSSCRWSDHVCARQQGRR